MRIAWFECATGISGDMTLAALIDAGADVAIIRKAILSLKLPDVVLRVEQSSRGDFDRCMSSWIIPNSTLTAIFQTSATSLNRLMA